LILCLLEFVGFEGSSCIRLTRRLFY